MSVGQVSKGEILESLSDAINALVELHIKIEFGSWERFEEHIEQNFAIPDIASFDIEEIIDEVRRVEEQGEDD